jgi:predicted ribosome quality control (RQC) complex YloA/Tae2 family protein
MKQTFLVWIILICLGLTAGGCSREKTFHSADELDRYVHGNDWPAVQTVVRNGIRVSVRYLPSEALLIPRYKQYEEMAHALEKDQNAGKKDSLLHDARKKIEETKGLYDRSLYFSMTIGYEDSTKDIEYEKMKEGFTAYSTWMQKLVFGLKEYITLETETTGEIPLDVYDMQRTFGITKERAFLLIFPRKFNNAVVLSSKNNEMILRINEFGLATGTLDFLFKLPFQKTTYLIKS